MKKTIIILLLFASTAYSQSRVGIRGRSAGAINATGWTRTAGLVFLTNTGDRMEIIGPSSSDALVTIAAISGSQTDKVFRVARDEPHADNEIFNIKRNGEVNFEYGGALTFQIGAGPSINGFGDFNMNNSKIFYFYQGVQSGGTGRWDAGNGEIRTGSTSLTGAQINIQPILTTTDGLYIKSIANYTGDYLEIDNSADGPIFVINSDGSVAIGAATGLKTLDVVGSARVKGSGSGIVLTGSINPTASVSVVGVGTAFTTELVIGDRILVSTETRTVKVITDATNLTVSVAFTDVGDDASPEKLESSFTVFDASGNTDFIIWVVLSLQTETDASANKSHERSVRCGCGFLKHGLQRTRPTVNYLWSDAPLGTR